MCVRRGEGGEFDVAVLGVDAVELVQCTLGAGTLVRSAGALSVEGCLREGEEGGEEDRADEGRGYFVDDAPVVVNGDQAFCKGIRQLTVLRESGMTRRSEVISTYPEMIIPKATPTDKNEVYSAITAPRSCRKKTSEIVIGAIVSAAPAPKPIKIRAVRNPPYVVSKTAHIAVIR